jgi:DNA-binding NarL/FixJ family response regulator
MTPIRILLADDHPLFRDALRRAVSEAQPEALISEVGDIAALIAHLESGNAPDLLLLDLAMPGARGFSALVQLQAHYPQVPVLVVSATEDARMVSRALGHGARGFVPKSASRSEIAQALTRVLAGESWLPAQFAMVDAELADHHEAMAAHRLGDLTPQQFRIALLLAEGKLNKQIGIDLGISENTVKVHVSTILQRLRLSNRTQVAVMVEALHVDSSTERPGY